MIRQALAAAIGVCALAALARGESASGLQARIARVEDGLQTANRVLGKPAGKMRLAERMQHYKVPGVSVAVIHRGRVEWVRGYGERDLEAGQPVTTETLFQAASISKSVAAAVALKLVEQGALSLDEDVNLKLKSWKVPANEFTRTGKVTLRRLLSHSAGLTVHGFPGYAQGAALPSLAELLDGAPPANTAPVRVSQRPGSGFRYSGGGYEVMQLLVEDVTGKRFDQLAREMILDPLGMRHSTFEQPLGPERARNAATGYRRDGKPVVGRWHSYPEKAAAGLWTTPEELASIVLEIQTPGRVLQRKTVEAMLSAQAGSYGLGVGLGAARGRASFSHGGANEGFRCQFFGYRAGGDGAVVMTNGDGGAQLAAELMRSISAEYGWADFLPKERKEVEVARDLLASYVGDYPFEGGPVARVRLKGGNLLAGVGEDVVELVAQTPTSFFHLEEMFPAIRFVRKSDGSIELEAGGRTAKRKNPY